MRAPFLGIVLAASAALASACSMNASPMMQVSTTNRAARGGDAGADDTVDFGADAVLASVAEDSFLSSAQYFHAATGPYPSTAAVGSNIDTWVTRSSWAEYSLVDPAKTGSGIKAPVGTVIVRAVLDAAGNTTKLTLMAKGPAGYNPALGDWWFGETDPYGVPLKQADGTPATGRLSDCYGCHIPRAKDDYLFGVPSASLAH